MIVREILNKDFDMDSFDHFNDSKDTLMHLRSKIFFPPIDHEKKLREMVHKLLNSLGIVNGSDGMYEDTGYEAKFDKIYLLLEREYEVRLDLPRIT